MRQIEIEKFKEKEKEIEKEFKELLKKESLKKIEIREFKTRRVEIDGDLTANISGRQEPVKGFHMVSENTRNRQPLEIVVTEGHVFNVEGADDVLVIPSGTLTISGVKEFDELKDFQKSEGELQPLPIRDPDVTEIDGRTFKQTGTLHVRIVNARVILER